MPSLFQYHIFISHAWRYSDDYFNLRNLLDKVPNFVYHDYSISRDKSLAPNGLRIPDSKIKEALYSQISHSTVVLSLLGMYEAYREWMQIEAKFAKTLNKPLIGIKPWGQQYTPTVLSNCCDTIVGWNTESIITSIRNSR